MYRRKFVALSIALVLFLTMACSMSSGLTGSGEPTQDSGSAVGTRAAQMVASTSTAQAELANALSATLTAMAGTAGAATAITATPTSMAGTPGSTPAPGAPHVSVSVETNCRSGPGSAYAILGVLKVGETAEVVGRSVYNDNWIIKLPSDPSSTCWLWAQYATVTGDTSGLKAWNPPPTPTSQVASVPTSGSTSPSPTTPKASFDISFYYFLPGFFNNTICLSIRNTGTVKWESYIAQFEDLDYSGATSNVDSVFFLEIGGPPIESIYPGSFQNVLFNLPTWFDPRGHTTYITLTLCTENSQAGTCTGKGFQVVP